ncbi:MAG: Ppx/GppA family phosphatase [Candidatus Cloacimonetes bacterium]|nr:Ppx/GppA family phosphatase [Candidatus Cloacimonadota bacterium]MBT4576362.1 Ppx/GppA family phosphatase [Candidatus Cloacimonadota bacterium]MBT5419978.1 Ppx/GppA family phosphatase [Candidatus Cloacimonadota bacterium]
MDKYAILDIGTNSIKFFLFSIENGKLTTIIDTNNISRLGEGLLKTGIISDEAMDRNIEALRGFMKSAKEENVKEITAVGTMCLRTANNSDVFLKKAKEELGLTIKVIPGEEEARLSYLAVLSTIGNTDKNVVVFDTGGGSTEFIFGKGANLNNRISLNLGAVHPTEEFLVSDPVTNDELKKMQDHMMDFFSEKITEKKADYLIGIGGTVTSMGAVMHKMVKYDPKIIQGSQMSLEEVKRQIELYQNKTIEERKQIPGLQPKRADVILAGAGIINAIMEIFEIDSFTISDRGLRHGLMFDKYLR